MPVPFMVLEECFVVLRSCRPVVTWQGDRPPVSAAGAAWGHKTRAGAGGIWKPLAFGICLRQAWLSPPLPGLGHLQGVGEGNKHVCVSMHFFNQPKADLGFFPTNMQTFLLKKTKCLDSGWVEIQERLKGEN